MYYFAFGGVELSLLSNLWQTGTKFQQCINLYHREMGLGFLIQEIDFSNVTKVMFYLESKLFVRNVLVRSDPLDPIPLSYLRDKPP